MAEVREENRHDTPSSSDAGHHVPAWFLGYTYRIAITNRRILGVDDDGVQFTYKDYRSEQRKVMTLTGQEFVRRFLQHILPKGLMRVRHYGFLANRCRRRKLDLIRVALKD
ncbi:transposase [Ectothiorhodospira sp. BSL-9]|uniref:transposase n=1 Tax=Ectothiorhodospira sp. BSL-9 TaxID=1442136 RepID=UPI00143B4F74|nr:transposase [Ectothiorhodospira sp. BSL-9]